jgi:hypothetical protein
LSFFAVRFLEEVECDTIAIPVENSSAIVNSIQTENVREGKHYFYTPSRALFHEFVTSLLLVVYLSLIFLFSCGSTAFLFLF